MERRRAIGVQLADGTEIRSDVVVSNINAKTLYQNLIGYERLPWLVQRGVRSYRYDNACPMVYLGLDYVPPLTAHHTFIAPTLPEINGWWRGRAQRPIPQQQFGMIDWPTFSDPALNYWWDTHAYQQSNKISPLSATVCVPSALVMIASTSTTV
ncbi:MAG TPA: hypothetical protein VI094_23440 [Propionibacteriaceae bacterium]